MKSFRSIARRLVIGGVLASFVATVSPAVAPAAIGDAGDRDSETRLARLDPSAVLGGADGLMPPHERGRDEEWQRERSQRRPDRRRGEERREARDGERERDAS